MILGGVVIDAMVCMGLPVAGRAAGTTAAGRSSISGAGAAATWVLAAGCLPIDAVGG